MKRATLPLLLTLLLLPAPASAAPAAQEEPISLDLVSADVRDVLRSFEKMAECRLDLAPEVGGKVSLRLSGISWRTALDAVCESAGCSWRLSGSSPRVLEVRPRSTDRLPEGLDTPVRLEVRDLPAVQAFTAIAVATGRALDVEGEFATPLSVTLEGVTAETALTALCEAAGCDWSLSQDDARLRVRPTAARASTHRRAAGRAGREITASLRDRLRRSLDLSLAGAPLGAVLQSFGQVLEVPVEIGEGVEGSVTIELAGVPFEAALNAVCAANGCRWSLERGAAGTVLRIRRAEA